jgi:hypothetical protein
VNDLSEGINGTPRIKKSTIENVKALRNNFDDLDLFKSFIEFGL